MHSHLALTKVALAGAAGLIVVVPVAFLAPWQLTVLAGWSAACLLLLGRVWPHILRDSPEQVAEYAAAEDDTRAMATLIVLLASVTSLVGVGLALHLARQVDGAEQIVLTVAAVLTVALSWSVVNTEFTLRYAHLYHLPPLGGIDFGDEGPPDYRDFAYLAFTIGMTYQVSDTGLRTRQFRRTVLGHSMLSYLFGAVIIATMVNTAASFVV